MNNEFTSFPIKYYLYVELVSEQTFEYFKQYNEYRKLYANIDEDPDNVNLLATDDMPNFVPYVMESNVEGGLGMITAFCGSVDSIIIETLPPY